MSDGYDALMSLPITPLCAIASILSLALTGCAADLGPSRDLTLRHVVLYQNGIGYFERAGVLRDEKLHLRFRERELDDVLKTLVVVEQPGAGEKQKPSTVTALLPQAQKKARDPEEATWLDVVLSPHPKGEISIAYAVPTAAWKAAYRVVLPDERDKQGGALLQAWALIDNVSEEDWNGVQLTLATGAPLTFSTHLRDVRFVDRPEVRLDGATTPRGPVYAESTGGADRDGDGIPDVQDACPDERGAGTPDPSKNGCPSAVRVVVTDKEIRITQMVHFAADKDDITPEARRILDEVARVMAQNPRLDSLVVEGHAAQNEKNAWEVSARRAGAVRAYLLAHGVTADVQVESSGAGKPIADDGSEKNRALNRRVSFRVAESQRDKDRREVARASILARSVLAGAVPKDVAGAIRYDITDPVTIPKMSSTMVTIVNQRIPGEDVLLFRPDSAVAGSDLYPFRAARIVNESGFGLQAGSVAIFGGGTFVGEGLVEKLERGQTAYIPYGLDGAARVQVEKRSGRAPLRILAASKGTLTVEDEQSLHTRYQVTTGDRPAARLFVRHARNHGYEPDPPPAGTEATPEALLVPIAIAPRSKADVKIEERQKVRATVSMTATDATTLEAYLKGSSLPPDAEKRLRDVIAARAEVDKLEREMASLRARLGDLGTRTGELRESLRAVERTPRAAALQQKLVERLAEAAKDTEDVSRKLTERGAALGEAKARISESLRDLVIEDAPVKVSVN